MIKAFVGAGGKTTLLKKEAEAAKREEKKVFVTTSTHMFIEKDTLLTDDPEVIIRELEEKGYAMAGIPIGEKITALSKETYEKVCRHADVVLVEADGSKHMPVKFPNEKEPVIYENVEEIEVVCGLHALGKRIREAAHRPEKVCACLQSTEDTILTASHIQTLVQKGYVEPLREQYTDKKIQVRPNGARSLYERAAAALLEAEMDVSLLKEEWFTPQPKLMILGGGHVSSELVKMAARLDFSIRVMDDRADFASAERFPEAKEVICDSFENLEYYMEPDTYYIVVTRGHKGDFQCVLEILKHSYAYVGMIGSKRKVANVFEHLREEGISEELIQSVHAPIGLKIGAVTPAEIAISILAEIIQEKNKIHASSVSRELLEVREEGMLCIIIDKTGSAPRGVGSMMFVTADRVIDSIGGGAVEFVAIQEARQRKEAGILEYSLNSETVQNLGMICGGSNKVLFIPIPAAEKNIGCVIMASGLSVRYGKNKLLEEFEGKSLIQRVLDHTSGPLFAKRIVVTRSPEVEQICREQGVEVLLHTLPNRNDTVRLGVEKMAEMDGCLFCPCDQPLLKRSSLEKMVAAFQKEPKGMLRLIYGEKQGTPVLFGKEYFPELLELPEKKGGSYLLKKYPEAVKTVEAEHEMELFDIDTPEDWKFIEQRRENGCLP